MAADFILHLDKCKPRLLKQALSRFSAPSIRVGKAVRNYSVCMEIRWQLTSVFKVEFHKICESLYKNTRWKILFTKFE